MFRSKKKKEGNAGRKRREIDDEEQQAPVVVDTGTVEAMEVDESELSSASGLEKASTNQSLADRNGGDQEQEDEEAMLERMRNRTQKNKSKVANAMSFSSKAKKTKAPRVEDDDDTTISTAATGGCLSFEEEESKSTKKKSKLRIRPNLSMAAPAQDDEQEDANTRPANLYSEDMLASLLREQKVLLRRPMAADTFDAHEDTMGGDMEMEGDATGEYASAVIDEEMKGESAEEENVEEFIPLNAKAMHAKKNKRRVTFGVHNEEFYPSKATVVEEPINSSDGEVDAEEDDQNKRWEDELMRRGGGRHVQPTVKPTRGYDSKVAYPTRRKVSCASLSDVMHSVQRKLEMGSVERDRVARELARLDVETELLQKSLQQQRDEHRMCSEQFEYFQEVEDFVKGLSFCLREKLPQIETEEKSRQLSFQAAAEKLQKQRDEDIQGEIQLCLGQQMIERRHFVNLPVNFLEANDSAMDISEPKEHEQARSTRFRNRYDSGAGRTTHLQTRLDVFADVVDDMSSLSRVSRRFQAWKTKFPDIYKNAYCDLALSKLYAPYVRAEIIDWDPLLMTGGENRKRQVVSEMEWFKTMQTSQPNHDLEEPVITLLREIIIARVRDAIKNRYDPYSPLQTQSLVDFLEDLARIGAIKHMDHGVDEIATLVFGTYTDQGKQLPLLALNQQEATVDRAQQFAAFLVGQFCTLLENGLTLFVALPNDSLHQRGFTAVMQMLHQLLAYVNHCKRLDKTAMLPQVNTTVQQLSSSSFMQSILARSTQEQFEFQRVLHLLTSS